MTKIAFIGLGHMGGPMAANLIKAGHEVVGFDLVPEALEALVAQGGKVSPSLKDVVEGAELIITMLPEGRHSASVYLGESGIFEIAPETALFCDCSTIDIETTIRLHEDAQSRGLRFLDAPVSGGVGGARAGTLTFMVGGSPKNFEDLKPYLEFMGKRIVHCGDGGAGQAAKICNNMVLGISMIGISEAFNLAEKLGLSADKFFEVASGSSTQCWALTSYCPSPGLVKTAPSNNHYQAGFMAHMMLKDLKLASHAAESTATSCPLGAEAMSLYNLFCNQGEGEKDFSGIINFLRGNG
ncbi:3-hydroxyisobutyrate dehydrogenase [Candidatus Bealeia paramacronuclearis]|uniref:3-hydroxyisobutyrate dehydrogenase n=1 Tax=Candidatus Bealeia paramacronuclearis TaxID=1921001 RepID=A0ABZ2C476_9PROT|nr:3-hydroxyisobutyrate dehydrogenase [Candidatus Bealeia paramacronuclearis]